jgi:hypothetical protein
MEARTSSLRSPWCSWLSCGSQSLLHLLLFAAEVWQGTAAFLPEVPTYRRGGASVRLLPSGETWILLEALKRCVSNRFTSSHRSPNHIRETNLAAYQNYLQETHMSSVEFLRTRLNTKPKSHDGR